MSCGGYLLRTVGSSGVRRDVLAMQYTSRILSTGLHPPLDTRIFKLILVFVRVYCHATLTTYVLSRGKLVLLVGLQSLWRVLLL